MLANIDEALRDGGCAIRVEPFLWRTGLRQAVTACWRSAPEKVRLRGVTALNPKWPAAMASHVLQWRTIRVLPMRPICLILLLSAALASCARTPRTAPTDLLIHNVRVVDLAGGHTTPASTVWIRAGRIQRVGPAEAPTGLATTVVDGRGGYLIPGLWDMHAHWYEEATLPIFLAHGVTGIRQMRGFTSMSAARARGIEGTPASPRVYLASPLVDGPRPAAPPALAAADPQSARALVALASQSSADFLKVYDQIPRDAYLALIEEARRRGVRVEGHVPIEVGWKDTADLGVQRSFEHLHSMPIWTARDADALHRRWLGYHDRLQYNGGIDASHRRENAAILGDAYSAQDAHRVRTLLAALAKAEVWQVPTCVLWRARGNSPEAFLSDPRMRVVPAWMRAFWASWWPTDAPDAVQKDFALNAQRDAFCLQQVAAMHAAGVPLLAGSDTIMPGVFPGSSLHEELALMVEAGLSPLQALRTATTAAAEFMGRKDIGDIAPGMLADLVLLEADPLQDIANLSRIAGVSIGGHWLDRATLRAISEETAAITAAPLVATSMAELLQAQGLDAALAHYEAQCPAAPVQRNCSGVDVGWEVGSALAGHRESARMPQFLDWFEQVMQDDPDALMWLAGHIAGERPEAARRVLQRVLVLAPGDLHALHLRASLD